MKPSERRALQEKKRAQMEAEWNEKKASFEKSDTQGESSEPYQYSEQPAVPQSKNSKPYKRKEGFFQSHVRLITFIISTALVIFVLGPIGIDMLIASRNSQTVTDKEDIGINAVCAIYDRGGRITWDYFDNYNYTDYSSRKSGKRTREYPIKGSRLVLRVQGDFKGKKIYYVHLIDYVGEGDGIDTYVDVLVEDPRDFFEATMKEQ